MTSYGHVIGGPSEADFQGATLTSALTLGDLVLSVDDAADFDEDALVNGGRLAVGLNLDTDGIPDLSNATLFTYATCDGEANTVTLATGSPVSGVAGDRVYLVAPTSRTLVADFDVWIEFDDGDGTGDAVPAALTESLSNLRGLDLSGQAVAVEEDDDGQLIVTSAPGLDEDAGRVKGKALDSITVTSPGDQTIYLKYRPIPQTEHLRWNGMSQEFDDFTRNQWTVSVPDPFGMLEVGDVLSVQYLYTDPTPSDQIECRQILFNPGNVFLSSASGPPSPPANIGSVVVGAADQWVDGDDATYSTMTAVAFSSDEAHAPLPTLAEMGVNGADVTAAEIRCRVSSSAAGAAFIGGASSTTVGSAFGTITDGPYTSDTPNEITDLVLMLDASSSTLADVVGALAGPDQRMSFIIPGSGTDLTVYEAVLVLTVCKPASEWV